MPTTYMAQNIAERERLRALVARLSEADLSRDVGHGWTVAAVLVHLAFWDRHRLLMLKRWLKDGQFPASGDADIINDTVAIIGQAIPPRAAAQMAVEAAEAIDYVLEQLTPDQEAALESAGMTRLLNRSLHRRDHLEEIERALA
jgi:hypothetical protein